MSKYFLSIIYELVFYLIFFIYKNSQLNNSTRQLLSLNLLDCILLFTYLLCNCEKVLKNNFDQHVDCYLF